MEDPLWAPTTSKVKNLTKAPLNSRNKLRNATNPLSRLTTLRKGKSIKPMRIKAKAASVPKP